MLEKLATALVAFQQKVSHSLYGADVKPMSEVIDQSSGEVVPNISYPGDDCCVVYADPNFSGTSHKFCID